MGIQSVTQDSKYGTSLIFLPFSIKIKYHIVFGPLQDKLYSTGILQFRAKDVHADILTFSIYMMCMYDLLKLWF